MAEARAALDKLREFHEGVGASVRVLVPLYSGETFGRVIYVAEHESADGVAAQLKVAEAAQASGEAPLPAAIWGADPSLRVVGSSILADAP